MLMRSTAKLLEVRHIMAGQENFAKGCKHGNEAAPEMKAAVDLARRGLAAHPHVPVRHAGVAEAQPGPHSSAHDSRALLKAEAEMAAGVAVAVPTPITGGNAIITQGLGHQPHREAETSNQQKPAKVAFDLEAGHRWGPRTLPVTIRPSTTFSCRQPHNHNTRCRYHHLFPQCQVR